MLATPRRAARVLLVDGAGRILLFRGFDPGRPGERYWFTVGGGLGPESIGGHRRWTVEELETTDERYYPSELPGLLRRVLEPLTANVRAVADEVRTC